MDFKTTILNYFNLSKEDYTFLTRPIENIKLPSFDNFIGIDIANDIIKEAMKNGDKIVIYGDYDCDGIMATSIMVKCFSLMNYKVGYYVPSRYIDGYGLNEKRVEEFYNKGYKLIITVDNGIAQFAAIKRAYELGLKVIITDHHEPQNKLPEVEVILHPTISHYGDIVCCGAYVAFMLASKLLNQQNEYLLSLAAIATISDMMELKSYNRDIVRLGIYFMNKNHYKTIDKLAEYTEIDENVIGLKIAPKINAVGRMIENTSINYLIEYFVDDKSSRFEAIYQFIESTNDTRKELTSSSIKSIDVLPSSSCIMLTTDLKEGIIGLVANNLMNKYLKPTIVFTYDSQNKEILKGSARSKKGLAINKFFLENNDILLTSGGHEQAGGLSLLKDNFDELKKRFEKYAYEHHFLEEQEDYVEINITDINEDNYLFLKALSPFGEGFKMPLLKINNISVHSLTYAKSKMHILYHLSINQKIIGFNYSEQSLENYDFINVFGTLSYSYFNNKKSFDYQIKKITDKDNRVIQNDKTKTVI